MRTLISVGVVALCASIAACSDSDGSGVQQGGVDAAAEASGPAPDSGTADATSDGGADDFTAAERAVIATLSPLPALPPDKTNAFADSAAAATLGQRLFFDKSYSGALAVGDDGTNGALGAAGEAKKVSCASCHQGPTMDDTRSKPNNVSLGLDYVTRNALSLVNSSFYKWTNWGGRFDSQWSLPLAVAENARLMGSSRLEIAHLLYDKYRADYDAVFPVALDAALAPNAPDAARFPASGKPKAAGAADGPWEGMTPEDQALVNRIFVNYGKAIAAYTRKLVSRNAPFDRYVSGQPDAIDAAARRGLKVFIGKGACVGCHSGPNFADDSFHVLGVPQTGPRVPAVDLGRFADVGGLLGSPFNSSGVFSDDVTTGKLSGLASSASMIGQFRTKSLRGASASAPYMHSGQLATLEAVVDYYVSGGADAPDGGTKDPLFTAVALDATEKGDLVSFLRTLDGEPVPAALLTDTSR
jgi:cytochrome c peroxidase